MLLSDMHLRPEMQRNPPSQGLELRCTPVELCYQPVSCVYADSNATGTTVGTVVVTAITLCSKVQASAYHVAVSIALTAVADH